MTRSLVPALRTCAIGIVPGLIALPLSLGLQRFFPYPFLFLFLGSVMVSSWRGGIAAGLISVLLSALLVTYFFVPPIYSLEVTPTVVAYDAAFIISTLLASWASSAQRRSEQALRETRDQLEARIADRTAEMERSNAELREREHQLAHLSRVLTMGELTTSIAHEISQPLTAIVANGYAGLAWLAATPPNLPKAQQSIERIIQDGTRAGAVLSRIRAFFKKETAPREWLEMNEAIQELTTFLQDEARRRRVSIRTQLDPHLPPVYGDRVQLQQVVLNLVLNGMDAMDTLTDRPKNLWIVSRRDRTTGIRVRVEDSGIGLSQDAADVVFEPFYTTKPQGLGMGLSIARSIVEAHNGHLTAAARDGGGAAFEFAIPAPEERANG